MDNLIEGIPNGPIMVSVRPEEFLIHEKGIPFTVRTKTFLGKYTMYELAGANGKIEFSQDMSQSSPIYDIGDTIKLYPNIKKINVFTENGDKTLVR